MILLDTNVVSGLMRSAPEPAVEAWVRSQPSNSLYFSSVSEAELRYGAAILPVGRRRETLFANIEGMLRRAFGDRVLSFDRHHWIRRTWRTHGQATEKPDAHAQFDRESPRS